MIMSLKCVDTT